MNDVEVPVVDRAYIYFFDDKDKAGLHASSGITRNFQPKPSFHALAHLQRALGEYRFQRVVTNEPGKLRVQEYKHGSDAKKIVWVAWSPTGEGRTASITFENAPGRLLKSERMPLAPGDPPTPAVKSETTLQLEADKSPLYLFFQLR